MLQPKNITTSGTKKGKNDNVLFQRPSYTSTGDLYKSQSAMLLRKFNASDSSVKHEAPFRSLVATKEKLYKASYIHLAEKIALKKNYRDEDGRVKLAPPNIVTQPSKPGIPGRGSLLGRHPEHKPDLYEAWRLKDRVEREESKAKMQEQPFRSRVPSHDTICKVSSVLAEDVPLLPKPPVPKQPPALVHEKPFTSNKPPRSGFNCTLSKYPPHMPNPPKRIIRRLPRTESDTTSAHPAFKMTYKLKSRPSSSIALNHKNLKSSFPSLFRK